jgi:hypothetical protein
MHFCEKNEIIFILNAVSVTFHDFVTFYPSFFLGFQTCCETAYDDGWKILQVPIAYISLFKVKLLTAYTTS